GRVRHDGQLLKRDRAPAIHQCTGTGACGSAVFDAGVSWPGLVPGMYGMNIRASVGMTRRLQIGDSSMPPTITQASGCCTCEPMPVEMAAGTRPMQAENPVMNTWRMRVSPALTMASSEPMPVSMLRRM